MSIELLQTLSIVSYIAAGVLFLAAIALFFLLNVPELIGYLSGSAARKEIQSMRQSKETVGERDHKQQDHKKQNRKRQDYRQSSSGKNADNSDERFKTLDLNQRPTETKSPGLSPSQSAAAGGYAETRLLKEDQSTGETVLLTTDQVMSNDTQKSMGDHLSVDVEIGFAGSAELIE